jgi:hypothetical protein
LLHESTDPKGFHRLFRIILLLIVFLRVLQRIQPPLNILIRHRRLTQHPLEFPLPRVSTLAQRRDLRITLRQVPRKLPNKLDGPIIRNQTLDMRIVRQMQRPRKIPDRHGILKQSRPARTVRASSG